MKLAWMAFGLIAYSVFVIQRVMPRLPPLIPTSFNWQGHPTNWSRPEMLWSMLFGQVAGAVLLLAIPYLGRFAPQLVSFGRRKLSDIPPAARRQLMPLLENMCGWMATLFCLFFSMLIRDLIRAALSPGISPSLWPIPAFVASMGVVVVYYLRQFNRVAQQVSAERARREGLRR